MKILVTGGCGYIGSLLVPFLLSRKHLVVVSDPQWFGNGFLPENENLTLSREVPDQEFDTVIHLAGLTSDTACRLNPEQAQYANVDFLRELITRTYKIRKFIFMSSVAVYGNGENLGSLKVKPTTPYGEFKKECEILLWSKAALESNVYIIRSAGVVGYAPRMRFDLTLNKMCRDAFKTGVITVCGGEQLRPHVHINDLIDIFLRILDNQQAPGTFNLVRKNMTVLEAARLVKKHIPCEIDISERTDDRSYSVLPQLPAPRTISSAIEDLRARFKDGYWRDAMKNPDYMNIPQL